MRKVGLIAAATLMAAAVPLMSANAQGSRPGPAVGGGGGGMARGGGAPAGGAAIGAGGGAFRGGPVGGISRGNLGGRGPVAVNPTPGAGPQANGAGRPGWSGRPGWHGGRHHHRRWIGPGIGFGTGFALGAYAASPYYYGYGDPYYYDEPYDDGVVIGSATASPSDVAYCQQRFKSYDVRSGTYLGYDGQRHPCP